MLLQQPARFAGCVTVDAGDLSQRMVAECLDVLTRHPAGPEDRHAVFLGHLTLRAPSPKLVSPSAMEMDFLAAVNMRCNVRPVKRRVASGRGRLGFRRDA